MLKAMKGQLSLLAIENGEGFTAQIGRRVKDKEMQVATSRSLNLIMTMPDLIAQIRDASGDEQLPPKIKALNQFLLIYLYHPVDFLPDDTGGLFGYLDDAYFVGQVYRRIRLATHKASPASAKDLTMDLTENLDVVRRVIPKETRKIDNLIEELIRGKSDLFEKLLNRK